MCWYSKGAWREAKQEKEKKRLEREQKKKEKEEEQKKKKALAAERKALAEEKKALAAAKKAENNTRKARVANNLVSDNSNRKWQSSDNQPAAKKSQRSTEVAATKGLNSPRTACFEIYRGDDEVNDWLQCTCKRWLHEECITDNYCTWQELLCPYCLL